MEVWKTIHASKKNYYAVMETKSIWLRYWLEIHIHVSIACTYILYVTISRWIDTCLQPKQLFYFLACWLSKSFQYHFEVYWCRFSWESLYWTYFLKCFILYFILKLFNSMQWSSMFDNASSPSTYLWILEQHLKIYHF